jgi:hypothetical protein
MDGQQLWAFHLELLPAAKIQQTVGTITFTCSASCTMRILDLPDEIDNHMVDMGGTGSQAISEVVRNRHVYSKPTAGGGIKFTRYSTRDNLGTFSEVQLSVNKVVSPFERPTHVQVSGAEIGEAVDQAGSRLYGYRFTQADNPYLDSVTDSARESVLLLDKTSKETTVYRIEMQGLPWGESGDLITHGYSARGDTPGLGNTQMVVRGHNWVFGPEVSRTMLTCRPA